MKRGWGPSGGFSGQTGFQQTAAGTSQLPRPTVPPGCALTLCFLLPSHPVAQGLLGIQDLGQVFFEPIKDKQGNILIVTLKEVKTNQTFESVRWVPICKLQTSRKSVSSPEEPTALDTLLISLQVCLGAGIAVGSPGKHQWSLLPLSLEGSQQRGSRAQPASKNPVVSRGGIKVVPDSPWQTRAVFLCRFLLQLGWLCCGISTNPSVRTCPVQQCLCSQDKLAYHQRSSHALSAGLYLGYLKLCSAVDQIRVLVPEQLPNILCHVKIRSNPNISRWDLQGSSARLLCLTQANSIHHLLLQQQRNISTYP